MWYTGQADHAYEFSKVRKLNSDRNDVLSILNYVIEKNRARSTEDATGTLKGRESAIKPMSLPEKQRRKGTHQYRIDF